MAFMMPVVKNDYKIYPTCPSRSGLSTPQTRGSSLSSSPGAASASFMSSPRSSQTPAFPNTPKSGSETSLHKFHSKLLDKLRKTFRGKDDDANQSSSSTVIIR
ncbi:uncharacterized protein LOC118202252 [Stegodyphus dumicola]|uniref:uncharacterized protein LOC118202252 n=1 Tax=Stegodyphus dumicola TaxID=202533 RepID=UPI0015B09ABF|nr:uncharacterized protein LOC118202252 [Stegodyphus dumicola]